MNDKCLLNIVNDSAFVKLTRRQSDISVSQRFTAARRRASLTITMTTRTPVRLTWLPLIAGLLPLATYHLCFVISASVGHLPWCNPYIDSCTSISATGRQVPEMLVFKGLIIPAAIIIAAFWVIATHWLQQFGAQWDNQTTHWMGRLGTTAALFLVIYTVALGIEHDAYRTLRRVGALLSFTLTYLAQLLLTLQLRKMQRAFPSQLPAWPIPVLSGICAVLIATGVVSLLLDGFYPGYDQIEDAFEWGFALLLNVYFVAFYFVWRALGVRIGVRIQSLELHPCANTEVDQTRT